MLLNAFCGQVGEGRPNYHLMDGRASEQTGCRRNAKIIQVSRASDMLSCTRIVVRDTGIEPVTSSVSGKRSPAELIAPGLNCWRWRRESNPCARLCRPLPHHSATPPFGLMPLHPRADDGIRTRDPNLGKVVRYQLRYIRVLRARSSLVAKHDTSPRMSTDTNPLFARGCRGSEQRVFLARDRESGAGRIIATCEARLEALA
jgi:hypothetical protein